MTTIWIRISPEEAQICKKIIKYKNITDYSGKLVSLNQLIESRVKRLIRNELMPVVRYITEKKNDI